MPDKNAQKCPGGNTKTPGQFRERGWCFTSFLDEEPFYHERCKYLLYAPEVCPETGRNHWQGYVYFYDKVSMKLAQKLIKCPKVHFEYAEGETDENKAYIIGPWDGTDKNGKPKHKDYNPDYKVFGNEPRQGKRTDLDELKEAIVKGTKVDDIAMQYPIMYHQYGRTLEKLEDVAMRKMYRTEQTKGIWYYGSTGVGKSHKAFENYSPETHYTLINDKGWWDGYAQQEIVIINDFRGWISYDELLQLVDKWPHKVRRRGREPIPFTSKKVIITSSLSPEDVYCNRHEKDSLEQLYRRFEIIQLFNENEKYEFLDDSD